MPSGSASGAHGEPGSSNGEVEWRGRAEGGGEGEGRRARGKARGLGHHTEREQSWRESRKRGYEMAVCPSSRAISSTSSSFLIPTCTPASAATALSRSAPLNELSSVRTVRTSEGPRLVTERGMLKAESRSMVSRIEAQEVVPMMSSFFPLGGALLTMTRRVWRTRLENRGPIATYSRRRSMSSRTMTLRGDLAASSNVLLM
mmetsp:Transcript_13626/g.23341  ORF Transcript_13626/g.23341 Transcript_13626/m.23341 type:complete len:202 (-) Transcript_13626:1947-2552(-)